MEYVPLGIVLLVVAAGLCAVLIGMMARHLLVPPRMTDGKAIYLLKRFSPEDLGLPYEPIDFTVDDTASRPFGRSIRIAAWLIPAHVPSSRTVMIVHGYSDAKVGGIAWAPVWRSMGWNVLAVDLRAHGESGGRHSTGGYYERDDLDQVIDLFRNTRPRLAQDFAIFGVSLGAACAAAVGARREDLFAVVMESPYADYRIAVRAHGRRLAMPLEWAYDLAFRVAERFARARFSEVRPVDLIPEVHCPLLVIHAGKDTFVSPDEIARIGRVVEGRGEQMLSKHVVIGEVQHTMGLLKDPQAYRETLQAFVREIDQSLRTVTAWEATCHG